MAATNPLRRHVGGQIPRHVWVLPRAAAASALPLFTWPPPPANPAQAAGPIAFGIAGTTHQPGATARSC